MIKSIKHRGLKRFFEKGDRSKINPDHAKRLSRQLQALNAANIVNDLDIPGYRLHPLKGFDCRWAITVSGNWRLTFDFTDGDVYVLDYEDYH